MLYSQLLLRRRHRAKGVQHVRYVTTGSRSRRPPEISDGLRSRGIVMFPSDLGIDLNTATRDWLAAQTIDDLVTASGGIYVPPANFRPTTVTHG
jgi:hypothetical protein